MKIITLPCGVLSANMYIVYDEASHKALVIDPIDANCLKEQLDALSLSVCGILLTHAHYDHAAQLQEIKALTAAPTFVHPYDEPLLTDPVKNVSAFLSQPTDLGTCDRPLSDGDTVEIGGFSVSVMHTPGHTPGSVCLILDDVMFSGDTVFASGIGRCDLYGGDSLAMRDSLMKIVALDKNYRIYPGHGQSAFLQAIKPTLLFYIG